jgi:parallel beta-helix repeat protein
MRLHRSTAAVAATILLWTSAVAASAKTVVVKNGEDLQAAIDGAAAGDTIVVRPGIYGPVSITGRTDLTIAGRGKAVVNGAGSPNCLALTDCQNVSIKGLTFADAQATGVLGTSCERVTLFGCKVLSPGDNGILFSSSRFITLDRNTIDEAEDDGIAVSESAGSMTGQSVVKNNRISNVYGNGILVNGNDDVVSKNQIRDSHARGVFIQSGVRNIVEKNKIQKIDGVGILVQGGGANSVRGNIVLKPASDGISVASELNFVSANIVTMAGQAGIQASAPNNEITKNRITKSGTFDLRDTTGGTTNIYKANKAKTLDPADLSNPKK